MSQYEAMQLQQQQQQPYHQQQKKQGGRNKPHWNRQSKPAFKRVAQPGLQSLGFFGTVPSLQSLQAENRRRTKRHYRKGKGGRGQKTPTTAPPLTSAGRARFHAAGTNPLDTPLCAVLAAPPAAAHADEPGLNALDFYGTNEGLPLFAGAYDATSSDSDDEQHTDEEEAALAAVAIGLEHEASAAACGDGGSHSAGAGRRGPIDEDEEGLPGHVRARLAHQDARIAQLEDDNLRLRERVDMLHQELARLRAGRLGTTDDEAFCPPRGDSPPAGDAPMPSPLQPGS